MIMNYLNNPMVPGGGYQDDQMPWFQPPQFNPGMPMSAQGPTAQPGPVPGVPGQAFPQQLQRPQRPDMSLNGWDGVNDKMRYFAQTFKQRRGQMGGGYFGNPGGGQVQPMSGTGGGGGGFGQLLHSILGGR